LIISIKILGLEVVNPVTTSVIETGKRSFRSLSSGRYYSKFILCCTQSFIVVLFLYIRHVFKGLL